MDGTVAIICNEMELQFSIEDVVPDILKDSFDLPNEPKTLYECGSNLVIPYKRWQTNLKPGCPYYLKTNNASVGKHVQKDTSLGQLILHSLIASTAVYSMSHKEEDEEMCQRYLLEQLDNHNFESVIQSKHGENVYIIAKELNASRVYIAFRGTQDLTDWKYNLQADRESCNSSLIPGKFHSGFLHRAQQFPIDKILHDEQFKDMDVIVCGHSLGGAIAAIVAIRLQVERARYKLKGYVKCITFGAPMFGDTLLQKSIDCSNIYHFVCNNDPVPYLLNYTQMMSSVINSLDAQFTSLTHQFSSDESKSYYQKSAKGILDEKVRYQDTLEKLIPIVGSILEVATLVHPGLRRAGDIRKIFSIINDVKASTTTKENVYVPIGNYVFLDDRRQLNKSFQYSDRIGIQDHIENRLGAHREDINSNAHAILHYRHVLKTFNQPEIPFASYEAYTDCALQSEFVLPELRIVKFVKPYTPVIHSVMLTKVESRGASILRLRLTGRHLFEVVLPMCHFLFNFPFAANKDTTTIKRVSMGESVQRVILEEPFKENLAISDHGTNLIFVTQFGMCEKIIRPNDFRDVVNQSVEQIAGHDSVSLVVRRAIQRGMALAKIKLEGGSSSSNTIIEAIKELGDIALGHEAMKQVQIMFDENQKDFNFILSNEDAFQKVKDLCDKIENYLRSPMEIQAEWSAFQKIVFSLTIAAGTAAVGYLAGPGLVIIGLASGSPTTVAFGGMFGCLVAGAGANALLTDKLTDSLYENALKWINQQLLEANEVLLEEKTVMQVLDLQDDGSIYSHEKILMLLTNNNSPNMDFGNSTLSKCTAKSKEIVRRRIRVIKKIHKIREIFSQQCFIGVVGLQDAGKTTLLKKVWGVGGKTGFFTHTDVPLLYEITPRLLVVDFPGSNSLDYHAKTFSICGAMNNMVIVVIPFTGDISKVVSDEMQNVFSVMRGSDSTKVIMCVNKCGLHLERLKEELQAIEDPIDFLKKRFIDKLNEHYENCGMGFNIKKDNIFFTDWEIGDREDAKEFGINGVEAVKSQIKDYLVSYGIYKEEDRVELDKCTSYVPSSV